MRAGAHSQRLHDRLFADVKPPYLQVDKLRAPVAGNRRHSWLWMAIEPVSKIIPTIHLGTRRTEDAYRFVHDLSLRLAPDWAPDFTSDGLRGYSHVLMALGLAPEDARATLRLSLGHQTTDEEIDFALETIPPVIERLRQLSPTYKKPVIA